MADRDTPPDDALYEYRVVPAPRRGARARGIRTPEGRLALALTRVVNHMAASGWEFVRADTLPFEERAGLTQTVTRHHSLLVFRRAARSAAAPLAARAEPVAGAEPAVAARRFWNGAAGRRGAGARDALAPQDADTPPSANPQVIDLSAARASRGLPGA